MYSGQTSMPSTKKGLSLSWTVLWGSPQRGQIGSGVLSQACGSAMGWGGGIKRAAAAFARRFRFRFCFLLLRPIVSVVVDVDRWPGKPALVRR